MPGEPWRLIIDPPLDGPENMARDEALLDAVGRGQSPATLRFYRWSPPTISLGYFQRYADYLSLPPPAGDLAVVRRLTGGGAILHDRELTYAIILPLGHELIRRGGPRALYDHVHDTFARWLAGHGLTVSRGPRSSAAGGQRGPFFCFERHSGFDLMVGQRKLMGSAQRRTVSALLQHGSLIIERRFAQQECAAAGEAVSVADEKDLESLGCMLMGGPPSAGSGYTALERATMAGLREKYAGSAWTRWR